MKHSRHPIFLFIIYETSTENITISWSVNVACSLNSPPPSPPPPPNCLVTDKLVLGYSSCYFSSLLLYSIQV